MTDAINGGVLKKDRIQERDSGIELFRIITMLIIVAHHYVVNSGLIDLVYETKSLTANSIFLLLFGWGGKTGINCFVMITGYFMCKSNITIKKFLKLFLQLEFYHIILYLIFIIAGYRTFSVGSMIKAILPVTAIADGFTSAYMVFFLFIPFLNILVNGMNKKQHLTLICLCVGIYTIWATLKFKVVFNYVTWFSVIYIIGAYLRLYHEKWFDSVKVWGLSALASLLISWCSVIAGAWLMTKTGKTSLCYYLVADSNKPLALITAVCAFMLFKNLHIGYNKFINTVAAASFGVLLIHANSNAMRQWLWKDTLNNAGQYNSSTLVVHAICSVLGVYTVCTIIDILRIKFAEKPFFKWYDKHYSQK